MAAITATKLDIGLGTWFYNIWGFELRRPVSLGEYTGGQRASVKT